MELTPEMQGHVEALMRWLGHEPVSGEDGEKVWPLAAADIVAISKHAIDNAAVSLLAARSQVPAMRTAVRANAVAIANAGGTPDVCPYPVDDPCCALWISAYEARGRYLGTNRPTVQ